MAVSETNKRKHDYAVKALDESALPAALKEDLTEVLTRSLEATNGFTPEEKLQSCTENQFNLARLMVLQLVSQSKHPTNWKDVLISVKREAMYLGFAIAALLALRPQIALVVDHIIKK